MATKHPYVSSTGALIQVLDQLRKSFPTTFNSETLKKLNLAPGNESYILNILRFLGLVNDNDARTELAHSIFTLHDDGDFHKKLSEAIRGSYVELFSLHHEEAWTLTDRDLIPFFRQTDKTTELVGTRQAGTFRLLSKYSGHEAAQIGNKPQRPESRQATVKKGRAVKFKPADKERSDTPSQGDRSSERQRDVGLTVRIEINLPATGDQETYDKIFKSIKENFLNA